MHTVYKHNGKLPKFDDDYDRKGHIDEQYVDNWLKRLEEKQHYNSVPKQEGETEDKNPAVEKEFEILKTKEKVMQQMIKIINDDSEPLKKFGTGVVGDIFDRVESLRQRILEMRAALEERRSINRKIIIDVEDEIMEIQNLLPAIGDTDKKREFKMHITLLNMERRRENANFWRDVIQLTKEVQELEEQYRLEMKISKLFSDLGGK